MSDSFQIGDLAECIADHFHGCGPHPRIGDVLRVTAITSENVWGERIALLHFADKPMPFCWQSEGFRKVKPKPDRAPASECFRAWLGETLKTSENHVRPA